MAKDRKGLRASRHKVELVPHAVQIRKVFNPETEFNEYSVIESDLPKKGEMYPKPRDERIFRIVPSPLDEHLVLQYADIGNSRIFPLELAAKVIAVYHTPRSAKRRLLSEARDYAERLINRWGAPLLTSEGKLVQKLPA